MGAFTPTPQAGSANGAPPSDGAPSAAPQGAGQQANALQQGLAQIMQALQLLGQQNEIIAPDMNEAMGAIRKAFLKTVQTPNQQQQPPTPSAF